MLPWLGILLTILNIHQPVSFPLICFHGILHHTTVQIIALSSIFDFISCVHFSSAFGNAQIYTGLAIFLVSWNSCFICFIPCQLFILNHIVHEQESLSFTEFITCFILGNANIDHGVIFFLSSVSMATLWVIAFCGIWDLQVCLLLFFPYFILVHSLNLGVPQRTAMNSLLISKCNVLNIQ